MIKVLRCAAIVASMIGPVTSAAAIELCSGSNRAERKVTCLVDGDTGWEDGVKWRLVAVDTPEYAAQAECPIEVEHAKEATFRMLELMRSGYSVEWVHQKDRGRGRELARIRLSDGRDAGDTLKSDGLAVDWPHRPMVWCSPES